MNKRNAIGKIIATFALVGALWGGCHFVSSKEKESPIIYCGDCNTSGEVDNQMTEKGEEKGIIIKSKNKDLSISIRESGERCDPAKASLHCPPGTGKPSLIP